MQTILKLSLTLALLILPFTAFTQSSGNNLPGPVYVSPDGKTYVRSKQPIYIRLSVSPDENAKSYYLRNDASKDPQKEIVPFYLEGHGEHTLVHPKDHKNVQKRKGPHLFRIYDDGQAPKSTNSVSRAPSAITGKRVIYGKPVTVTLNFKDTDSGLHSAYYAIDSAADQKYLRPILLKNEKDYDLKYYAIDNVGNQSDLVKKYYALDFTAPTSNHILGGPHFQNILSPKAIIKLKSYDEKAGVDKINFRFKGKKQVYKNVPLNMNGLEDGQHSIIYGAIDRVQNLEENVTYNFYLDKIPPKTRYFVIGDKYHKDKDLFVSGRSTIDLAATDNKAGVRRIRYYVGKKDKMGQVFEYPFGFPKLNGKTTFAYAASDRVINISKKTTKEVIVDISAPTIKPVFKGEHYFSRNIHYIRRMTEIIFDIKDNLSGVQGMSYTLDAQMPVMENKAFSIPVEGLHEVSYTAVDNVNNKAEAKKMSLYVDEKPPQIFHHFSVAQTEPDQEIYPTKVLLYLASTDKQSGIRKITYQINNGSVITYKSAALLFNKPGTYKVEIKSIDNVANMSRKIVSFEVRKF
jgi:hypothetical protein